MQINKTESEVGIKINEWMKRVVQLSDEESELYPDDDCDERRSRQGIYFCKLIFRSLKSAESIKFLEESPRELRLELHVLLQACSAKEAIKSSSIPASSSSSQAISSFHQCSAAVPSKYFRNSASKRFDCSQVK